MTLQPKISPHGQTVRIDFKATSTGFPEAIIPETDWLQTARDIKTLCTQFSSYAGEDTTIYPEDFVAPMQLDTPANGLILRRTKPDVLTIQSLYLRERSVGESVTLFLPIPVAMRLAEFMGRLVTGAGLPRERTRSAPGAKAPR